MGVKVPKVPSRHAEGVRGEWGGALPSRLGGMGVRRKLPQWGPGGAPAAKCILVNFYLPKRF